MLISQENWASMVTTCSNKELKRWQGVRRRLSGDKHQVHFYIIGRAMNKERSQRGIRKRSGEGVLLGKFSNRAPHGVERERIILFGAMGRAPDIRSGDDLDANDLSERSSRKK